jgi:hypothetical protein
MMEYSILVFIITHPVPVPLAFEKILFRTTFNGGLAVSSVCSSVFNSTQQQQKRAFFSQRASRRITGKLRMFDGKYLLFVCHIRSTHSTT